MAGGSVLARRAYRQDLCGLAPGWVIAGQLELKVGQHAEVLATGDSASFAGDLAHGYLNVSSAEAARFALTVFEPAADGGAAR